MSSVFSYNQSTSSNGTNTLTLTNTAGNLLVAANAEFGGSLSTSVSDTNGNTWSTVCTVGGNLQFYVAMNLTSGSNTVTFNGGSGTGAMYALAEYNVPSSGWYVSYTPLPGSNLGGSWTPSLTAAPISGSSPFSEVMLIATTYDEHSTTTFSMSSGTVRVNVNNSPEVISLMIGDYDTTSPGSTISTTISGGTGNWYYGCLFLIKPSSGGASGGIIRNDPMNGGF